MIAMKLAKTIAGPFATLAVVCVSAFAQQPRQYTDQDYANAEKFMAYNVNPLAYKGQVNAQWLDDDRFWLNQNRTFILCSEENGGIPRRRGTIAAIPAYRRRPTAGSIP